MRATDEHLHGNNSGSKASYNGPGETSPHIYFLFLKHPLTNLETLIQITHTLFVANDWPVALGIVLEGIIRV